MRGVGSRWTRLLCLGVHQLPVLACGENLANGWYGGHRVGLDRPLFLAKRWRWGHLTGCDVLHWTWCTEGLISLVGTEEKKEASG